MEVLNFTNKEIGFDNDNITSLNIQKINDNSHYADACCDLPVNDIHLDYL